MSPESWRQLEELFDKASRLSGQERETFLETQCAGNGEMLRRVRLLLAADETADRFMDDAVEERGRAAADVATQLPEARMGPYRTVKLIGHGGMGAVYLAERADGQFDQRVAIKLVRAGHENPAVVERFLAERRILASLAHPNIARLLDGGVTASGLPYFVMEYVDGTPITDYCRQHGLATTERLQLFREVCAAVESAHRALVVHRDIKPANILVTQDGVPKLLDFGIAGILRDSGQAETGLTRPAERLMTPEYAAPEQILGGPVTTATDVYALGLLLYELLTGDRPFRQTGTPLEFERLVSTTDPRRPSAVVAGTEPRLARHLKGDLDNIVLKALRKEPESRYASVDRLSEDIRSFLEGYPVSASKGTTRYLAAKFARRHRVAVSMGTLVTLLLAAFGVGMSVLERKATRERDAARVERARAETVSGFLAGLFQSADPFQAKGNTVSARDLLDQGSLKIQHGLQGQPEVEADLLGTMAEAYQHLGALDRAQALLEDKLRLERQAHGGSREVLVKTLRELGDVERQRSNYTMAERHLREALALEDRPARDDAERPHVLNNLGLVLQARGELPEAEELFRRAVEISRRFPGQETETLAMMSNLGGALSARGRYGDAVSVLRPVLERRRALLGDDHPQVAKSMLRLAFALQASGEYDEAERLLRTSLALERKSLGETHPDVLSTMNNLATLLQARGDWAGAEPLYRKAIETGRRTLGEDSSVAVWMSNLAALLQEKGDYAAAEPLYRRSLSIGRRLTGEESVQTARVLARLGSFLVKNGALAEADACLAKAIEIERGKLGADHPHTADSVAGLAELRERQKRFDEAAGLFRDALAADRKAFPAGHPQTATHLLGLARLPMEQGDAHEAEPLVREALEMRRRFLPAGAWQIGAAENQWGAVLAKLGRGAEAGPILARSYAGLRRQLPPNSEPLRLAVAGN